MLQNTQTILNLLEVEFPRLKVLVVGDLMLDRYIFGDVNRISPEAPVPILKHAQRLERAGGAANVTMNLAGLGVQSYLAGFWGKDAESGLLEGLLKTAKIDTTAVLATDRATTSKTRIVGHNQQMMRLDVDPAENPTAAEMQKLTEWVLKLVPQMNAVVLSDYDKGTLSRSLCEAVIRAARAAKIPVLADPKTPDLSKYTGATTVCPNLGELAQATGVSTNDMDTLLAAGQKQVTEHGFDFMTVTMSEKGISVLRPKSIFHSAAVAREVSDVSGAGDTVIATLAAGLAGGLDVEETVKLANIAAAIVVSKRGTVPVHAEELVAQLTQSTRTHATEKLLDLERLKKRVAEWRAVGETVVFTNGCFDILHVGHITLLEECRRFGSKLVVGMNTDASVCTLKGPSRPIVGERERARIMASLAATDAVILFNEETPIELIRTLKPDVLVKGGDYTVESVVGHENVASWGGRVEIVPTVEGFSTTNIVKKLSL